MDGLGGPLYYNHYPVGWAHAMDTPFQWTKQVASHFVGTRNGLVISWPKHMNQTGEVRSQFCSVIDITPTILEAAGVKAPKVIGGVKQTPIEGTSLVYTFNDAKAATHHQTQYFEMIGNRGVYDNGWVACTTPRRLPWQAAADSSPDDFKWELYHVADDFSEANNLVEQNPGKLRELQKVFDREAKKYNVLPLDASFIARADVRIRPSLTRGRDTFTYYPGTIRVPEGTAPDTKNKSFTVTAEVVIPEGGAEGVLVTQGGRFGGYALLLMDGKPEFDYAFSNQKQFKYRFTSNDKLAPGKHTIKFDSKYDGPGFGKSATGTLFVDGQQVAQGKIERTIPFRFSLDETFDVGQDTGTPVVEDYEPMMPFKFTGTLNKVVIDLGKSGLAAGDDIKIKEGQKQLEAVRE
jgi:hypothetical protein